MIEMTERKITQQERRAVASLLGIDPADVRASHLAELRVASREAFQATFPPNHVPRIDTRGPGDVR